MTAGGPLRGPGSRVGEGGLEPPRPCGHRNLNPARLPIPPLARGRNRTVGHSVPVVRALACHGHVPAHTTRHGCQGPDPP